MVNVFYKQTGWEYGNCLNLTYPRMFNKRFLILYIHMFSDTFFMEDSNGLSIDYYPGMLMDEWNNTGILS